MDGHPKTASEYVRIVEQAPDELDDILEAASYDFDEVEYNPGFIDALKKHTEKDLPCIRLFYLTNQTHRQGLIHRAVDYNVLALRAVDQSGFD